MSKLFDLDDIQKLTQKLKKFQINIFTKKSPNDVKRPEMSSFFDLDNPHKFTHNFAINILWLLEEKGPLSACAVETKQ